MTREILLATSKLRSCPMYSEIRLRSATACCDHSTRMFSGAFPLLEPRVHVVVGHRFAPVGGCHTIPDFASEPFVVGYKVVYRLSQQFVRAPMGTQG